MCCTHINNTQILRVFNQDKVFSKNCMRPNAAGASSGNVLILIQVWRSLCFHCECLCTILLMRVNKGILLCNVRQTAIVLPFRGSFKRFHEIVSFRLGVEPINERLCVYCWLSVAESIFFKKLKKKKQKTKKNCGAAAFVSVDSPPTVLYTFYLLLQQRCFLLHTHAQTYLCFCSLRHLPSPTECLL